VCSHNQDHLFWNSVCGLTVPGQTQVSRTSTTKIDKNIAQPTCAISAVHVYRIYWHGAQSSTYELDIPAVCPFYRLSRVVCTPHERSYELLAAEGMTAIYCVAPSHLKPACCYRIPLHIRSPPFNSGNKSICDTSHRTSKFVIRSVRNHVLWWRQQLWWLQ
jgi:hypothetical protein